MTARVVGIILVCSSLIVASSALEHLVAVEDRVEAGKCVKVEPAFCQDVDWKVPEHVANKVLKMKAETQVELSWLNYRGPHSCKKAFRDMQCRWLFPKCDQGGICRSECQKFVNRCHNRKINCEFFPEKHCYTLNATSLAGKAAEAVSALTHKLFGSHNNATNTTNGTSTGEVFKAKKKWYHGKIPSHEASDAGGEGVKPTKGGAEREPAGPLKKLGRTLGLVSGVPHKKKPHPVVTKGPIASGSSRTPSSKASNKK